MITNINNQMAKQIDKKKKGKNIITNDEHPLTKSNRYDLFMEDEDDDKILKVVVDPIPVEQPIITPEKIIKKKTWAEKFQKNNSSGKIHVNETVDSLPDDTTIPQAVNEPSVPAPAQVNVEPINNGSDCKLNTQWDLWVHEVESKDWTLDAYKKLYIINNLSNFWSFFNNFNKFNLRGFHFFIMREGVQPIWEDANNRNGGVCSIKVDITKSCDTYTDICMHTMNETIVKNMNDITGISFSPKNNWAIIKIWNRDKNNDIATLLLPEIQQRYADSELRYKINMPEY